MNTIGMTVAESLGLPRDWIVSMAPQGTEEWLSARRGVTTGSMAKVARATLKDGSPTKPTITYAKDTARARAGCGDGEPVYVNAAMRYGQEQEAHARRAYEARTGYMVDAAGFIATPDRKFGVSVDGLVFDEPGQRGGIEIKTIVSSNVLFDAVIGGDTSEYIDQCDLNTWAWNLNWIDLCLWAPDLPTDEARLTVIRIPRDQDRIDALLADLVRFDNLVERYVAELLAFIAKPGRPTTPPWMETVSTSAAAAAPIHTPRVELTAPTF